MSAIKGPFYLAETKGLGPMRLNDGTFIVMEGVGDSDDVVRPVLHVLPQHDAKRGKGYSTPDPDGEAFARSVVDLLNKHLKE